MLQKSNNLIRRKYAIFKHKIKCIYMHFPYTCIPMYTYRDTGMHVYVYERVYVYYI